MISMSKVVLLMVLTTTLIFGLKIEDHNLLSAEIRPMIPKHDQNDFIDRAQSHHWMKRALAVINNKRSEYIAQFKQWDKNGDGKLSQVQLIEGSKTMGVDLKGDEARSLIQKLDKNSDGKIDMNEFLSNFTS